MKYTFIILHYLALKDTIECVESIIENILSTEFNIIIVNNSPEKDSLIQYIDGNSHHKNIYIINNKENLGFARGNNMGFLYAKHILKSDFIIMINNDTIISQSDFCKLIEKKFKQYNFHVMGPDIITKDKKHQNPQHRNILSTRQIYKILLSQWIQLVISYFGLYSYFKKIKKKNLEFSRVIGDIENTTLHGSCLIFSPLYIQKFDGLDDRTFLYMEEDILRLYAKYYNLKLLYTSELTIFHKEDISTNMLKKKPRQKNIFEYKQKIKSILIYKKIKSEFNL